MINLVNYEGVLLDSVDSEACIVCCLKNEFKTIEEFHNCNSILDPSYWGDCYLIGTQESYLKWIRFLAERVLT